MKIIRFKTKNKVLDLHINETSPSFTDGIKFKIFGHLQQVPGVRGDDHNPSVIYWAAN